MSVGRSIIGTMENKIDFTFTRKQVEDWADRPITDREWEVMSAELESALEYYLGEEIQRLWLDIDTLIEEDDNTSF
jgi:hypothetical protein